MTLDLTQQFLPYGFLLWRKPGGVRMISIGGGKARSQKQTKIIGKGGVMSEKLAKRVEGGKVAKPGKRRKATSTKSNATAAAQATAIKPAGQDAMSEAAIAVAKAQGLKAKAVYQEQLSEEWAEFLSFADGYLGEQSNQFIGAVEEYYGVQAITDTPDNGIELIEGAGDGNPVS